MQNLRAFDPSDIDETLSRVVTHGGVTYLMFPYIDAVGTVPAFRSIGCSIAGPAATIEDFTQLSALVTQGGTSGGWFISFNTPWLLNAADAASIRESAAGRRAQRG